MSRRHWFPVPLFFVHAVLVVYHLYTIISHSTVFWIHAFLNRAFEMTLFYVIMCTLYRFYALNRREPLDG